MGEERRAISAQRLIALNAAAILLLDIKIGAAEVHGFLAAIGAEKYDLASVRLEAGLVEERLERHPGPFAVADQTLDRPTITGAFETGDELLRAHLADLVDR